MLYRKNKEIIRLCRIKQIDTCTKDEIKRAIDKILSTLTILEEHNKQVCFGQRHAR